MKLTGNPRGVQLAIVALLVITLWFACTRRSEAAEPVFFAGAGQSFISTASMASGLRFGMEQGAWQASLVTHGESVRFDANGNGYVIDPNIGACGTWHVERKRLSLGWGACVFEHGDFVVGSGVESFDGNTARLVDDGMQLTAAIVLRRTFGARERVYAEVFHASAGGSTRYNRGMNMLAAGVRF